MSKVPVPHWANPDLLSFEQARVDFLKGGDTPRALLERCIERIVLRDGVVKAFVTTAFEASRAAADASSRRYREGKPLSPLDGCPVGVKDIISTADLPTQMNSPLFSGHFSGMDAACVASLRRAGAVVVGKTVTTEFAIGRSGVTTNPFDPNRTPGGSSSGSAAAVASGMVLSALGTQTQGSLIRPASYCGVVAFKPTVGTLSLHGVHPVSSTCDHLGLMAATVADAWQIARQIGLGAKNGGSKAADAHAVPGPRKPRRLVALRMRGWDEADHDTQTGFEAAINTLKDANGVEIATGFDNPEVAQLESDLDDGANGAIDIVAVEMRCQYREYIRRAGVDIGPRIHELVERAHQITAVQYARLLEHRSLMRRSIAAWAARCDGFILLSSSGPAPEGLSHTGSRTFQVYGSWLGLPAFSLPLLSVHGLPVGIQLVGFSGEDAATCATAQWIVDALGQCARTDSHS